MNTICVPDQPKENAWKVRLIKSYLRSDFLRSAVRSSLCVGRSRTKGRRRFPRSRFSLQKQADQGRGCHKAWSKEHVIGKKCQVLALSEGRKEINVVRIWWKMFGGKVCKAREMFATNHNNEQEEGVDDWEIKSGNAIIVNSRCFWKVFRISLLLRRQTWFLTSFLFRIWTENHYSDLNGPSAWVCNKKRCKLTRHRSHPGCLLRERILKTLRHETGRSSCGKSKSVIAASAEHV